MPGNANDARRVGPAGVEGLCIALDLLGLLERVHLHQVPVVGERLSGEPHHPAVDLVLLVVAAGHDAGQEVGEAVCFGVADLVYVTTSTA